MYIKIFDFYICILRLQPKTGLVPNMPKRQIMVTLAAQTSTSDFLDTVTLIVIHIEKLNYINPQ